jgi:DNA polymerase-3 subunit beta
MKFTATQEKLVQALQVVQRSMGVKSTMPVLEGIYLNAADNMLTVKCTDSALCIEKKIEAVIEEEGAIVLPGVLFSSIIRKLTVDEIEIYSEGLTVTINYGLSHVNLQGISKDEFPEIPMVESEQTLVMEQPVLRDMIRATAFAVSVDETKPILMGGLLEASDDIINMVALDGYRLAIRCSAQEGSAAEASVVTPVKSLNEISKVLGDEGEVSISLSKNYVLFDIGDTKITSRLLDGEYIKYKKILPEDYQTRISINNIHFLDAVERASIVAREGKNNLIKLVIQKDKVIITSNSEIGDAYEELEAYMDGKELEIAFNAKYMLDILKAVGTEEYYMDFNSNVSPCVVRPREGNGFLYLILPVRIYQN